MHVLPHDMCKVAGNVLVRKQTQHVVACDVGVGSVGGLWTSWCDRTLWVGKRCDRTLWVGQEV